MCALGFTAVVLAWGSSSSWARATVGVVVLDGSPACAPLPGKQVAPGCPALTPVIEVISGEPEHRLIGKLLAEGDPKAHRSGSAGGTIFCIK